MLKRLELLGFKSFADRTRFDFAPGVTAVVGPNGSGKSNIVDAVRWLLGEQSAKALRGGEMTDVIFNGSPTRKSLGMAEVSMTFDNTNRRLDHAADEVRVTRRVYRDGQGEYEINGREARLKDVRDLFLGSGAGQSAYSVIEQGRVDALLAATPRDRRGIFEEASGISRFKAKKLEALRKLERVDADLVRVHDILGELDGQVRTLGLQAAKAEKHAEYSARLRHIRVAVARAELSQLDAELHTVTDALTAHRAAAAGMTAAASAGETALAELDRELTTADQAVRQNAAALSETRTHLARLAAGAEAGRAAADSVRLERDRLGQHHLSSGRRLRTLSAEAERIGTELDFLRQRAVAEQARAEAAEKSLAQAAGALLALGRKAAAAREGQFSAFAEAAKARGEADAAQAQADRFARELARKLADQQATTTQRATLTRRIADLARTDDELRTRAEQARQTALELAARRQQRLAEAAALQPALDRCRESRSALRGRADVLTALETSLEGIGAGVRDVLARVQAGDAEFASAVVGLVADLLTAPRDVAVLVDLALGDAAQRIVLRSAADLPGVQAAVGTPAGRVGFLPLAVAPAPPPTPPGAVPLAGLVAGGPAGLVEQLLGTVFIVPELPADPPPGVRLLTRSGILREPDGSVILGPPVASTGLVSRKSELRDVTDQAATLEAELTTLEARQTALRAEAEALAEPVREAESDLAALTGEVGTLREQLGEHRQTEKLLGETLELLADETRLLEAEASRGASRLAQAQATATHADTRAAEAERLATQAHEALTAGEAARDQAAHDHTTAQVALGRVNEQLTAQARHRETAAAELAQQIADSQTLATTLLAARHRERAALRTVLDATAQAADLYARQDAQEAISRTTALDRATILTRRTALQDQLRRGRSDWQERRDAAHAQDLVAQELTGRRSALLARFHDDYALDLTAELAGPVPTEAAQETTELRAKIESLGAVNAESIPQLAAAETRATDLRAQFDDLTEGRAKLIAVIEQINTDSRALFADTLAAIRTHFQEIFRKLFGGGVADITLDGDDLLEAGVEVIAHPPGKQAQRISLLSGGERALVAAALLLAMFRARPGPFCLLDEIDAAMDDANTDRLGARLAEVAGPVQFVVITHKKRMMAHADALHGVTMQESGVSKLIAVRFEDWPDEAPAEAQAA